MPRVQIKTLAPEDVPDVEAVAKVIITDAFWMQKHFPGETVPSKLPIPMARGSRKRVAKKLRLAVDNDFHSLYDKAIHRIRQETEDGQ